MSASTAARRAARTAVLSMSSCCISDLDSPGRRGIAASPLECSSTGVFQGRRNRGEVPPVVALPTLHIRERTRGTALLSGRRHSAEIETETETETEMASKVDQQKLIDEYRQLVDGRAGRELVPATAGDFAIDVIRMDVGLHGAGLLSLDCRRIGSVGHGRPVLRRGLLGSS